MEEEIRNCGVGEKDWGCVAVVTGAARGLGRAVVIELCRRRICHVYLTVRDEAAGSKAVGQLQAFNLGPLLMVLDVTNAFSVRSLADLLRSRHGGIDYLVNNAAVFDHDADYPDYATAKRNIDVNYRSLHNIERYFLPLLRENGRVVNVSCASGHLSNLQDQQWVERLKNPKLTVEEIDEFVDEYLESVRKGSFNRERFADGGKHAEHRVSKIALTALTMIWARKYASRSIAVNTVHPGLMTTSTSTSAGSGSTSLQYSGNLVTYLLLYASQSLTGSFLWCDRKFIDWTKLDPKRPLYYVHQTRASTSR